MIKWLATVAMLSAQATSPPPSAPPRCLTRQQVGDLSVVGASIFIRSARALCRERLPADAFLASPAAERYDSALRTEADRRLDSALGGIDRMFSPEGGGPGVVGIMLRGLMASGPPAEVAQLLDAPNCADLSLMVEAMSVMTPERLSQFMSAATSLGSRMHQQARERAIERAAERAAQDAERAAEDAEESAEPIPPLPTVRIPVVTDRPRGPKPPRAAPPTAPDHPPVPVPVMRPEPPRPAPPFICPE